MGHLGRISDGVLPLVPSGRLLRLVEPLVVLVVEGMGEMLLGRLYLGGTVVSMLLLALRLGSMVVRMLLAPLLVGTPLPLLLAPRLVDMVLLLQAATALLLATAPPPGTALLPQLATAPPTDLRRLPTTPPPALALLDATARATDVSAAVGEHPMIMDLWDLLEGL